MAEAHTSTRGGFVSLARVSANKRVPATRLSRILAFWVGVQRRAAMFSPARCTVASIPSSWTGFNLPDRGSQRIEPCRLWAALDERTRAITSCWFDCTAGTRAEPTRPVEPEIRIFIVLPPEWRYFERPRVW